MDNSPEEREQAIEKLHSTARSLMRSKAAEDVAEIAVEAIRDILDMPFNGVFYHDDEEQLLRPVAWTSEGKAFIGQIPSFGPGDSLAWHVYETGQSKMYADVGQIPERYNPKTAIGSEIIVPIDDHGVLLIGSVETGAFDESDVSLVKIVASHMTVALDRIGQEQELREKNERLNDFASVVSHDLRNPLNIAQARLQLAAEEFESEHHDQIDRALTRMSVLIDDLLKLAREGKPIAGIDTVALDDVIGRCWETVDTEDAVLIVTTDQRIEADESRLTQLLENLFRNAVEHGGNDVTVSVGDLADESGFFIEDDGTGIPPEKRDQVFDPGYSSIHDGTGFGLSIVRKIAQSHGWEVRITEAIDGGARFEITGVDVLE